MIEEKNRNIGLWCWVPQIVFKKNFIKKSSSGLFVVGNFKSDICTFSVEGQPTSLHFGYFVLIW